MFSVVAFPALVMAGEEKDPDVIEQSPATAVEANPFSIWPADRWSELAINIAGYQCWIIAISFEGAFSCLHTLKVCDTCAALAPLSQVDDLYLCAGCIEPSVDAVVLSGVIASTI